MPIAHPPSPVIASLCLDDQGAPCLPDAAVVCYSIGWQPPAADRAAQRRAQSVQARQLGLDLLRQHHAYCGDMLPLQKRDNGAPWLDIPFPIAISLSHSGPWAGCAVTSPLAPAISLLGIDIEVVKRRDWQAYAEMGVFHPAEMEWIMACDGKERDHRALTLWCRKEAVLKAAGLGIALPLAELAFAADGSLFALPGQLGNMQDWRVYSGLLAHEEQEAIYALAWQSGCQNITI